MNKTVPYKIIQVFGPDYIDGPSNSGEVRYYCPKCLERRGTPDTKGKLYVNVHSLKFNCFLCGYKGQINRKLKFNDNLVYEDEKEIQADELIKQIDPVINEQNKFNLKIPLDKVIDSPNAFNYLLNRGFTQRQCEYYDLRVGNINNEFGRIIIPNQVQHMVYTDYYSARTYIDQKPKYHNPGKNKSSTVFNLHRIREETPIIVVEGALTAIAAGYHAVATLGKTITPMQASLILKKKPSVIYVNYDFGAETYSHEACRMIRSIDPNVPIYEVLMSDERDAADLSRDEYLERIKNAKLYSPLFDDFLSLISD